MPGLNKSWIEQAAWTSLHGRFFAHKKGRSSSARRPLRTSPTCNAIIFPRMASGDKYRKRRIFGWPGRFATVFAFALTVSRLAANDGQSAAPESTVFQNPQRITIEGYEDDAMEPFVTRDGKYLFFNNLNEPRVNTNLFWAERVDDLHFKFRGEIKGVNTPAL